MDHRIDLRAVPRTAYRIVLKADQNLVLSLLLRPAHKGRTPTTKDFTNHSMLSPSVDLLDSSDQLREARPQDQVDSVECPHMVDLV